MARKKTMRWGWIIFWIIVFWPVGLYLAIKKLQPRPKAIAIAVIAWFLIALEALILFSEFTGASSGENDIIIILIVGISGILLLRKSFTVKKTAVRYERYTDIINGGILDIESIAATASVPYDVVMKDLQKMTDTEYLENVYIDRGNKKVVFSQQIADPHFVYNTPPSQPLEETKSKSVRCPGCGALNVITAGKASECEYCGTPLNM